MSGSQAKYLDTRGNSTLGVGICDRCSTKRPLGDLMSDPNVPGLKVCKAAAEGCIDHYDPYRLPVRMPDPLKLPFNRTDQSLESGPDVMQWTSDEPEDFLRGG
jgi:hypothetical protein